MALAAPACSSDPVEQVPTATIDRPTSTTKPEPGPTTTTKPITTTTAKPTPEEKVAADYLRAEATFYEMATEPDPSDERIGRIASGKYAAHLKRLLSELRDDGLRVELAHGRTPTVKIIKVTLIGRRAGVEACVVDDAVQVRTSDDSIVNDSVTSRTTIAQMRETSDGWVVWELATKRSTPGNGGCK